MHMPYNSLVLFPLQMQESTEEFVEISEEEEDDCVVSLREETRFFIKRVFHHQKFFGQRAQSLN